MFASLWRTCWVWVLTSEVCLAQELLEKKLAYERAKQAYEAALRAEIEGLGGIPSPVSRISEARASLSLTGEELMPKANKKLGLSVPTNDWESRVVVGYHQAGANSAEPVRNIFVDFYIMRGLGRQPAVYENPFNVWGSVRIASTPRQIHVPVARFAAGFAQDIANLSVNELAQSAEFMTGIGLRLARFRQGGGRIRMLEAVAFFGGNGTFKEPFAEAAIYRRPLAGSPGATEYVAMVPADRERFNHLYGGGFRLTSFETQQPLAPPATYLVTLGQDQSVSGGRYHGAVLRMDVFYPLPVGGRDGRWKSLFLFGTVNMKLARAASLSPVPMERICSEAGVTAGCTGFKSVYDPDLRIITASSDRDTYRLGVGIDLVNLLRSWILPTVR